MGDLGPGDVMTEDSFTCVGQTFIFECYNK